MVFLRHFPEACSASVSAATAAASEGIVLLDPALRASSGYGAWSSRRMTTKKMTTYGPISLHLW